jgi:hypothetical protein
VKSKGAFVSASKGSDTVRTVYRCSNAKTSSGSFTEQRETRRSCRSLGPRAPSQWSYSASAGGGRSPAKCVLSLHAARVSLLWPSLSMPIAEAALSRTGQHSAAMAGSGVAGAGPRFRARAASGAVTANVAACAWKPAW